MRYKPKGVAALQMILDGFPDTSRVPVFVYEAKRKLGMFCMS